jgi:hypothetical protein
MKNDEIKQVDVISFGVGVQSTALLIMACDGTLKEQGYNVKYAIFANTGDEPKRVIEHYYFMKDYAKKYGVEVIMTSNGNIVDGVELFCETGQRVPSLPYFTRNIETNELGMLMRQCTHDYKIMAVDRYIKRDLMNLKKGQRFPKDKLVRKIIGISIDEFQRVKQSPNKWHTNDYPLFDKEKDRSWCVKYIEENIGYIPSSSECIICPYHSDEYWKNMKINHKDDWDHAVRIDRLLRNSDIEKKSKIKSRLYLYRGGIPLEDAELNENQLSLFDMYCGGGCGL